MKFYCISNKTSEQIFPQSTLDLIRQACEKKGIEFIQLPPQQFNFVQPPILNPGDILYRSSMGPLARSIERFLIRDDIATFYSTTTRALSDVDDLFFHRQENISVPKTILGVANNYALLQQYAEYLGGFPLVLKVLGKSVGAGVIRIDSMDALSSTVRLISSDPQAKFVLKELIQTDYSLRVIVLGDAALAAISYRSRRGDFRTNVEKNPLMEPVALSEEIATLAVAATKSLAIEFGGVDILVDNAGRAFVAEVNFPCAFPDVELTTGTKIAEEMVNFLHQKSARLTTGSA